MIISQDGINLIKQFEGCALKAYKCPAGVWTIGYGHTKDVKEGLVITPDFAEQLLKQDLLSFEKEINTACSECSLTQNEFDALVSLVFNIGITFFKSSTLLKKLKAGDRAGAAKEFDRWIYAHGMPLNGLIRRRKAERALFEKKD